MVRTRSQNVGKPIASRLSKEAWLEKALTLLAAEGPSRIRIENIAQALGVTRGSFYHHFADRGDFVRCLVQYWDEKYTREVTAKPELQQGTAQERLWHLMLAIANLGLAHYDAAGSFLSPEMLEKVLPESCDSEEGSDRGECPCKVPGTPT